MKVSLNDTWGQMWSRARLDHKGIYHPPGTHFNAGNPIGWTGPRNTWPKWGMLTEDEQEEEERAELTRMTMLDFRTGLNLLGDEWALHELVSRSRVEDGEGGLRTMDDPQEILAAKARITRSRTLAIAVLQEVAVLDVLEWVRIQRDAAVLGLLHVREHARQRERRGIQDVYSVDLDVIRDRAKFSGGPWVSNDAEWYLRKRSCFYLGPIILKREKKRVRGTANRPLTWKADGAGSAGNGLDADDDEVDMDIDSEDEEGSMSGEDTTLKTTEREEGRAK